mmetsp:Transcript_45334/g.84657  ORF Transcript_45334/g.84657 Transcript_45334/m.84657 type:complete len:211 (-) Transcript_45334:18-650(-)
MHTIITSKGLLLATAKHLRRNSLSSGQIQHDVPAMTNSGLGSGLGLELPILRMSCFLRPPPAEDNLFMVCIVLKCLGARAAAELSVQLTGFSEEPGWVLPPSLLLVLSSLLFLSLLLLPLLLLLLLLFQRSTSTHCFSAQGSPSSVSPPASCRKSSLFAVAQLSMSTEMIRLSTTVLRRTKSATKYKHAQKPLPATASYMVSFQFSPDNT